MRPSNKTTSVSPSSGTTKAVKVPGTNAGKKTDMMDKQKEAERLRALIKWQKEWNKNQSFWVKVIAILSVVVLCYNVYSLCQMDKDAAQVAKTLTNIGTYTPSGDTIASIHERKDQVTSSMTSYW